MRWSWCKEVRAFTTCAEADDWCLTETRLAARLLRPIMGPGRGAFSPHHPEAHRMLESAFLVIFCVGMFIPLFGIWYVIQA